MGPATCILGLKQQCCFPASTARKSLPGLSWRKTRNCSSVFLKTSCPTFSEVQCLSEDEPRSLPNSCDSQRPVHPLSCRAPPPTTNHPHPTSSNIIQPHPTSSNIIAFRCQFSPFLANSSTQAKEVPRCEMANVKQ